MRFYCRKKESTVAVSPQELCDSLKGEEGRVIVYATLDQCELLHYVLVRHQDQLCRFLLQKQAEQYVFVSTSYVIVNDQLLIESFANEEPDATLLACLTAQTFLPSELPFYQQRHTVLCAAQELTQSQKEFFQSQPMTHVQCETGALQESFIEILNATLKNYPNPKKRKCFLQACISLEYKAYLVQLGAPECREVFSLRYLLAPNTINQFAYSLSGEKPTIYAVSHYFVELIQAHLGSTSKVPDQDLILCLYGALLQTPIGSVDINFDGRDISNSEGLSTEDSLVLEYLKTVCEVAQENNTPLDLKNILWQNPHFYSVRFQLKKVLTDLVFRPNDPTHSEYFQIYDWICIHRAVQETVYHDMGIDVVANLKHAWVALHEYPALQEVIRDDVTVLPQIKHHLLEMLVKNGISDPYAVDQWSIPTLFYQLDTIESKQALLTVLEKAQVNTVNIIHILEQSDDSSVMIRHILDALSEEMWSEFFSMLSRHKYIHKIQIEKLLTEFPTDDWFSVLNACSEKDLKILLSNVQKIFDHLPHALRAHLVPALVKQPSLKSIVNSLGVFAVLLNRAGPKHQLPLLLALGKEHLTLLMRSEGISFAELIMHHLNTPFTSVLLNFFGREWLQANMTTAKQLAALFYHLSSEYWQKFNDLFSTDAIRKILIQDDQLQVFLQALPEPYPTTKNLEEDLKSVLDLLFLNPARDVQQYDWLYALFSSAKITYRPALFSLFETYGFNGRCIQDERQLQSFWALYPSTNDLTDGQKSLIKAHSKRIIITLLGEYSKLIQEDRWTFFRDKDISQEKRRQLETLLLHFNSEELSAGPLQAFSELVRDAQFVNACLEDGKVFSSVGRLGNILTRVDAAIPSTQKEAQTSMAHAQSLVFLTHLILREALGNPPAPPESEESQVKRTITTAEQIVHAQQDRAPATGVRALFAKRDDPVRLYKKAAKVLMMARTMELLVQGGKKEDVAQALLTSAAEEPLAKNALAGTFSHRTRSFFSLAVAKQPRNQSRGGGAVAVRNALFAPVVLATPQVGGEGSINPDAPASSVSNGSGNGM